MDEADLSEIHSILNKTQRLLTEHQKRESGGMDAQTFGWTVEGVMLVIVASSGFIGNIFCIIGFSFKQNKSNFHHLMLATAVFELLYISTAAALFSVPHLFLRLSKHVVYKRLTTIMLPLAHVGLTGSIYLTLAIAIERYTTVFHPFFKFSQKIHIRRYIAAIVIFSLLYNLPKFWEIKVVVKETRPSSAAMVMRFLKMRDSLNVTNMSLLNNLAKQFSNVTKTEIVPTSLRLNPIYVKAYLTYSNLLINGLLPMILIILINSRIYYKIKSLTQNTSSSRTHSPSEVRHTQASLIIALVFIVCHGVRWIPNIWEFTKTGGDEIQQWPSWAHKVSQISHLLTVLNASVNFYIYLIKHGKREFRSIGQEFSAWTESTNPNIITVTNNRVQVDRRLHSQSGNEEETNV